MRLAHFTPCHLTALSYHPPFPYLPSVLSEKEGHEEPDGVDDEWDDDIDNAKGMARLFGEVGEAYIQVGSSVMNH